MPTYYTSKIENNEITNPKDFIKLCLNEFGVMVHNYDNTPTTDTPDFDKIYSSQLNNAIENNLGYKQKRSEIIYSYNNNFEEYKNHHIKLLKEDIDRCEKRYKKYKELDGKYNSFSNIISNWDCSEKYKKIKDFALGQIEMSRETNLIKYLIDEISTKQKELTHIDTYINEIYESEIEYYDRLIKMTEDDISNIKKSIEDKKTFYDGFIEELKNIDINYDVYLVTDGFGNEYMCDRNYKPQRVSDFIEKNVPQDYIKEHPYNFKEGKWFSSVSNTDYGYYGYEFIFDECIELPKGTIKKLIGHNLSYEDEPVGFKFSKSTNLDKDTINNIIDLLSEINSKIRDAVTNDKMGLKEARQYQIEYILEHI